MKILINTLLFVFLSVSLFGQNRKVVNTQLLNVRSGPSVKYRVIEKVSYGEKVLILSDSGKWSEIKLDNGTIGYVTTKYLKDGTAGNQGIKEKGFKYGFKQAFVKFFFIIMLIIAAIHFYKSKRKKDGRYKSGYEEKSFSTLDLIMHAIYSAVICSIIGLFMGLFFWIKSF